MVTPEGEFLRVAQSKPDRPTNLSPPALPETKISSPPSPFITLGIPAARKTSLPIGGSSRRGFRLSPETPSGTLPSIQSSPSPGRIPMGRMGTSMKSLPGPPKSLMKSSRSVMKKSLP